MGLGRGFNMTIPAMILRGFIFVVRRREGTRSSRRDIRKDR